MDRQDACPTLAAHLQQRRGFQIPGGIMENVFAQRPFVVPCIVRYAWVGDNPGNLPNFEEIKAALSKLS